MIYESRYSNNEGRPISRVVMPVFGPRDIDNSLDLQTRNLWFQSNEGKKQFERQQAINAQQQAGRMAELQAQLGMQRHVADQQARLAQQQLAFQQNRFNRVLGLASPMLASWRSGYQGTGPVGAEPTITTGPIWTNQQVQEHVNALRSQADAGTASQIRNLRNELSGRGFSANSPLAMAFQQQALMNNLAAGSDLERQARWEAAQENATHLLKSQAAREQQYANRQQEEIERNKVRTGFLASILGALLGMA